MNKMTLDRRTFITNSVFFAAALAFPAPSSGENAGKNINDFVVLEKRDDAASLEELLARGNEKIPRAPNIIARTLKKEINVECRSPSLLYTFNMPNETIEIHSGSKNGGKKKLCIGYMTPYEAGSCLLLDSSGYFLTAYHVIMSYLSERGNILALYDPVSGLIAQASIVSFSEKWDIALGKIKVPEELDIFPVAITKGNPMKGDFIYITKFDPKITSSSKMTKGIMDSISVASSGSCDKISLVQKQFYRNDLGELGFNIYGATVSVFTDEKLNKEMLGSENGNFMFIADMRHGNSGVPVYTRYNDMAGIATKIMPCPPCDNDKSIVFCTSPDKIRELITNYITSCKAK